MSIATFFTVLGFAWIGYAGYRLWGSTASQTAKWVGMVLVGLLALGLTQDVLDARRESPQCELSLAGWNCDPRNQTGPSASQIVELKGDKVCLRCIIKEQDGRYVLESNWMAGDLKLEPSGTQPYALSFERGVVSLDEKALEPGCSSGTLGSPSRLQISGARQVRLEVGPGAGCR